MASLAETIESLGGDARLASHAVGVAAFVAVYAYLLDGIVIGRMYAFGDFPPYYGTAALTKFVETWHQGGLGFSYIYNTMPAYLGVITGVGGALAQNLFFLALIPVGFLAFFVFVGRFVDALPARYLAAGVYAINPLTIGEFTNGGVAALIGFAGLPIVLHYLYAIVERDDPLDVARVAIVFGATTVSPWLAFWMVAPFATHCLVRARHDSRKVLALAASGVGGIVLALPSVHHILQRLAGVVGEGQFVIVNTLKWNYAYTDPLLILRLAGNRGVAAMNELGYNTDPALIIGLVIPAVGLLAWRRRDLYVFYAIAAAIVTFIVLTAMGLTYPLFDAIPLLLSVRNPAKLQYPLLVCLSVLFGAGVEMALDGERMKKPTTPLEFSTATRRNSGASTLVSAVIVGLLVLSLVAYAMPAAGAFGLEATRGDEYYIHEEYEIVGNELDGMVLWVPYGYTTQLHLRYAYPNHVGIRSGGVAHGIPNVQYVRSLFRDFAAGRDVSARLYELGVQYVVVDSDPQVPYGRGPPRVVRKWGAPWLFGNPATFNERLSDSDAYHRVKRVGNLTIYRVEGVPTREHVVERTGLHVVVAPTDPSVERVSDNLVHNGRFEQGFEGWWKPKNTSSRTTRLVETDGGGLAVEMSVDASGKPLPLATDIDTRTRYPYQIAVEVSGNATVNLVWFDGKSKSKNRLGYRSLRPDGTPTTVTARGTTLSIRIVPEPGSDVVVHSVRLYRTTYPPATGAAARQGVPGVIVNGTVVDLPEATVVASNLGEAAAERIGADVRLVDAETLVGGPLVFDETYRQGVGVLLEPGERPESIPKSARAITDETANGRVVDYWVIGEFDTSPVTVIRTSYHEGWTGPPDATHFRANGWANGFVDAHPDEIRWTGRGLRPLVVFVWLGAWVVTLGGFVIVSGYRFARRRRNDRHTHALESL